MDWHRINFIRDFVNNFTQSSQHIADNLQFMQTVKISIAFWHHMNCLIFNIQSRVQLLSVEFLVVLVSLLAHICLECISPRTITGR
jgi:hypothetical protein